MFSFSEIKHLWNADSTDPLILEAQKNALAMQMTWNHAIGFDLTGASGNTDSFGVGIRLDSKLGNRMREYDFYLSYLNSTKEDITIVDETTFGVDYDSAFLKNFPGTPKPTWRMIVWRKSIFGQPPHWV